MENLIHELLIVKAVNAVLEPVLTPVFSLFGLHSSAESDLIPDYLVMALLIIGVVGTVGSILSRNLSAENPGPVQLVFEGGLSALRTLMLDIVGPKGPAYLTLVGTVGLFIALCNLMGLIPGLMAPTSNINVTVGLALTVCVYYHWHGVKEQGPIAYLKHFAAPPGAPMWIAPIFFPIEIISHLSRVLSLAVRLFGNVFGEELVIMILFLIIPLVVPLPMMFLGIITGSLQAFIFVMLTMIYLQGAVTVDHDHEDEESADGGAVAVHA